MKTLTLDKARLSDAIEQCLTQETPEKVRRCVQTLQSDLPYSERGDIITFPRERLEADLAQIIAARTIKRMHYYLRRLQKAISEVRTGKVNDINLNRWKEYDEIITDSLWIMERRDTSGAHRAWYWGNFIPQIPHQMMLRYTKAGDWVLDPFVGSGTTLIECRRLGRHGLGIEINPKVAEQAREIVSQEPNPHHVQTPIITGDSGRVDYEQLLAAREISQVQLLLLHPPYHDIIRFSDDPRDLSNSGTVAEFIAQFAAIVARLTPYLERGRYAAVVIGDKYSHGEWIPLGFQVMQAILPLGYTLKSIVVKNFDSTRAKREQKQLWRYRALVGGFYIFKHEYIFVFRKR